MSTVDQVRELVEPLVAGDGLELVDVEHGGGLLRITLDRPGGIDLDAITAASERISALLDLHDPIPGGRYTLEVTSPGLERPLRTPAHFRRFVGSAVNVKTRPEAEGDRRVQGILREADDEGIAVVLSDGPSSGSVRRLAYADIERARTVFEWAAPPKPGRR
jgi:ribosome maturation factor RimP